MNFWPFRSRPVITPFTDDFDARIIRFPDHFDTAGFSVSVPSNLYIVPSVISLRSTTVVGVRGVLRNYIHFLRGEVLFAGAHIEPTPSGTVMNHFICPVGDTVTNNTAPDAKLGSLPYPIYLYPDDRIYFFFRTFLAGDTFDHITIHGRFWEVH